MTDYNPDTYNFPNFGLTSRAYTFAKLYAENPRMGATRCAIRAGYARKCHRGAHVRANELLKDQRVVKAILHFSAIALSKTMANARHYIARLSTEEGYVWGGGYYNTERLTALLNEMDSYTMRLEKIYTRTIYIREHIYSNML